MAAAAVASAVGSRSWRAWAGRAGGEDFAFSDLAYGLLRAARWHMHSQAATSKACPICFDTPEDPESWLRLWCGCSVCRTCVSSWVKSALDDAAGAAITPDTLDDAATPPIVALSCPACSAPLRPCDAARVLASDDALLGDFDTALRDALLRGLRDFRPCPSCSGGGFITWRCVTQARTTTRAAALLLAALVAALCVGVGATGQLSAAARESGSEVMLALIALFARFGASVTRTFAQWVAADAPLKVFCPECDAVFTLAAADAAADAATPGIHRGADAGDDAWVNEHTRPCPRPSCRAPILKSGGCNAMVCGRCRMHFCWACMRPMRECTHFTCAHGAPHGNASIWNDVTAADGDRLAAAGDRAALLARCSALIADAIVIVAIAMLVLRVGGGIEGYEWAHALATYTDACLALPAEAWFTLTAAAFSSVLILCQLAMQLVYAGALGTLAIVALSFALHGVRVEWQRMRGVRL